MAVHGIARVQDVRLTVHGVVGEVVAKARRGFRWWLFPDVGYACWKGRRVSHVSPVQLMHNKMDGRGKETHSDPRWRWAWAPWEAAVGSPLVLFWPFWVSLVEPGRGSGCGTAGGKIAWAAARHRQMERCRSRADGCSL